ncbi:hypothetical protein [Streptomyces sp. NPDC091371]
MNSDVLEHQDRALQEPDTRRPALLAGEEEETPDQHIFRGVD